jgi:DNA-directed RNA polymerase specialized sigma54-like protein
MTQQLQQAITLAQSLSIEDQLELMKTLSTLIQQNHVLMIQAQENDDDEIGFSAESFRRSWHQAMTGQTLPLEKLWEDSDDE